MAAAEEKTSPGTSQKSWHGIVLQTLKRNDIRLVPYVPDRVLTPLIKNLHADPFFTTFATAREEEAVGIVSGAWTVLDDNGLPPLLGDDIAERTRQDIDATTGGIGYQNMHGPRRKRRLGNGTAAYDMCGRSRDMDRRCCGSDPEPLAHGILSRNLFLLSHIVASAM